MINNQFFKLIKLSWTIKMTLLLCVNEDNHTAESGNAK